MSSFRQRIFLIGYTKHQITGSKLPSIRDCFQVLFYNMRVPKLNLNESITLVLEECVVFWKKAKIPTRRIQKCKEKLKKLYIDWQTLVKNKNKIGEVFRIKGKEFSEILDDLFDIAHQNALNMIKIVEDKQFLIKQREKGRPGSMLGVDKKHTGVDKRRSVREEAEKQRMEKYKHMAMPTSTGVTQNCFSNCLYALKT